MSVLAKMFSQNDARCGATGASGWRTASDRIQAQLLERNSQLCDERLWRVVLFGSCIEIVQLSDILNPGELRIACQASAVKPFVTPLFMTDTRNLNT